MTTTDRKQISDALKEAMNKEDLHTRATAKALNLNPCYISMAQNPKSWDSMSNPAWTRLEEWYETREPLKLFQIPDGEPVFTPKERYNGERKEAVSLGLRAPNKNKKGVDKVEKLTPPSFQNKPPVKVEIESKQEPQFTDAVRLKVALDIEINLVVNGQKVQLR